MSDHRWSKFWWQDWQRDPALRSCGVAARGLWMDMLAIAFDGSPHGHVTIGSRPATPRQLATIAGIPERECVKLLAELEAAGVFSRTSDGTIYNRRMVRDKATRDRAVFDGKRGGNPRLIGDGKGGGLTPPDNHPPYPLEAEADTEAEKEDSKSFLDAATGEREAVAPSLPTVLPSSVTAVVGSLAAKLEGRARGQPFLTAKPAARTVGQQLAAVEKPEARPPKHAPPAVLAEARQALAERARNRT